MTTLAIVLLISTALYAGFQATVRLVVYPQLAAVGDAEFVDFERSHQRLITRLVGPLFVFEGASAIAAFLARPGLPAGLTAACCALVVVSTGLLAVPQHRRLSTEFDRGAFERLLRVDSVRLALAAGALAGAIWFAA